MAHQLWVDDYEVILAPLEDDLCFHRIEASGNLNQLQRQLNEERIRSIERQIVDTLRLQVEAANRERANLEKAVELCKARNMSKK